MINKEEIEEFRLLLNAWCKSRKNFEPRDLLTLSLTSFLSAGGSLNIPAEIMKNAFDVAMVLYKERNT